MGNDLSTQIDRAIQLAQSGQTAEALSLPEKSVAQKLFIKEGHTVFHQ
jgi:hypothetical protein